MSWAEWSIFVLTSSVVEALFWSRHRGTNSRGLRLDNIHLWLLLMRVGPWWDLYLDQGLKAGAMAALSFSFFHDGIYYQARHWIDGTYKNFFDTSTTSTAWYTLNITWRTITALFGILIYLL